MAAKPWHGWVMGESIRRVHALRRLAAWDGVYRVKTTTDLSNGRTAEVMKPARYPYIESAKPAENAKPVEGAEPREGASPADIGRMWSDSEVLNPTEMYDKYGDAWLCELFRKKGRPLVPPPPTWQKCPPADPELARRKREEWRSGKRW